MDPRGSEGSTFKVILPLDLTIDGGVDDVGGQEVNDEEQHG